MKDILKARPVESALLYAASSRAFVRQLVIESVLNKSIVDAIEENLFDKLSDEDKASVIYDIVEEVKNSSNNKNEKSKLLNPSCNAETLSSKINDADKVNDKYKAVCKLLNDKGKIRLFNSIAAKLKKDSSSDVQSDSNEDKKSDVIEKRLISIVKTALKDDIEKIKQLELNPRQREQLLDSIKEHAKDVDDRTLSEKNDFISKITYIASRCSDFDKVKRSIQNFLNKIDDENKAESCRASAQRFLADFDHDKDLVQKVHDEVNFDDAQNAEYSELKSLEEKLAYLLKYIDEERVQSIKDKILSDEENAKPSEESSEETTAEAPKMADDAAVKAAMGKISDKLSKSDQFMAYRLIQDYVYRNPKFKEDKFKAIKDPEEQHKYLLKLLKADEIEKICDDCIKRVQSSDMPSRPSSKEEESSSELSMMQKIHKFFKDKAGKKQYDKTSNDAFQKFLQALRTARADYDDKELLETQIAVYVNKHLFPCISIEASGMEVKKDKTIGFVVDLKQKDKPLTLGKLHEALNSNSDDRLFLKDKKFSQMFEHMALFTKSYSEKAVKWYLENAGLCISDASFLGIKNVMILANRVDRVRMYKFNGKPTLTFILDSIDLKKQFNKAFSE